MKSHENLTWRKTLFVASGVLVFLALFGVAMSAKASWQILTAFGAVALVAKFAISRHQPR